MFSQILVGLLYHILIMYHVTGLNTTKIVEYTMESKLDKEKGEVRKGNPHGKNRMLKETECFKELMSWGSSEKFGRMESSVSM